MSTPTTDTTPPRATPELAIAGIRDVPPAHTAAIVAAVHAALGPSARVRGIRAIVDGAAQPAWAIRARAAAVEPRSPRVPASQRPRA